MEHSKLNCPNCGAPIKGALCDYCGTVFYDLANVELGQKSFLRIKISGTVLVLEAVPVRFNIRNTEPHEIFYADGKPYETFVEPEYEVDIKFRCVPDEKGRLFAKVRPQEEEYGLES